MHILYLCPHGAAKSVLAVALTQALVERLGVAVTVDNAGTDPDVGISPIVLEALAARGLSYETEPRLVSDADITAADIVISLGCTIRSLPTAPTRFIDWSDAPNASDDVEGLCALLEHRIPMVLDIASWA